MSTNWDHWLQALSAVDASSPKPNTLLSDLRSKIPHLVEQSSGGNVSSCGPTFVSTPLNLDDSFKKCNGQRTGGSAKPKNQVQAKIPTASLSQGSSRSSPNNRNDPTTNSCSKHLSKKKLDGTQSATSPTSSSSRHIKVQAISHRPASEEETGKPRDKGYQMLKGVYVDLRVKYYQMRSLYQGKVRTLKAALSAAETLVEELKRKQELHQHMVNQQQAIMTSEFERKQRDGLTATESLRKELERERHRRKTAERELDRVQKNYRRLLEKKEFQDRELFRMYKELGASKRQHGICSFHPTPPAAAGWPPEEGTDSWPGPGSPSNTTSPLPTPTTITVPATTTAATLTAALSGTKTHSTSPTPKALSPDKAVSRPGKERCSATTPNARKTDCCISSEADSGEAMAPTCAILFSPTSQNTWQQRLAGRPVASAKIKDGLPNCHISSHEVNVKDDMGLQEVMKADGAEVTGVRGLALNRQQVVCCPSPEKKAGEAAASRDAPSLPMFSPQVTDVGSISPTLHGQGPNNGPCNVSEPHTFSTAGSVSGEPPQEPIQLSQGDTLGTNKTKAVQAEATDGVSHMLGPDLLSLDNNQFTAGVDTSSSQRPSPSGFQSPSSSSGSQPSVFCGARGPGEDPAFRAEGHEPETPGMPHQLEVATPPPGKGHVAAGTQQAADSHPVGKYQQDGTINPAAPDPEEGPSALQMSSQPEVGVDPVDLEDLAPPAGGALHGQPRDSGLPVPLIHRRVAGSESQILISHQGSASLLQPRAPKKNDTISRQLDTATDVPHNVALTYVPGEVMAQKRTSQIQALTVADVLPMDWGLRYSS